MSSPYAPDTTTAPTSPVTVLNDGDSVTFASLMAGIIKPLWDGVFYLANHIGSAALTKFLDHRQHLMEERRCYLVPPLVEIIGPLFDDGDQRVVDRFAAQSGRKRVVVDAAGVHLRTADGAQSIGQRDRVGRQPLEHVRPLLCRDIEVEHVEARRRLDPLERTQVDRQVPHSTIAVFETPHDAPSRTMA